MEKLKELLANECSFRPSGKLLDELLAPAESIELKKNEVLIMSGRLDPNVYIVKSGVMRYSYMNGIREVTFAFALPGSVMIAMEDELTCSILIMELLFYTGFSMFVRGNLQLIKRLSVQSMEVRSDGVRKLVNCWQIII